MHFRAGMLPQICIDTETAWPKNTTRTCSLHQPACNKLL